jgi:hypothetical protein
MNRASCPQRRRGFAQSQENLVLVGGHGYLPADSLEDGDVTGRRSPDGQGSSGVPRGFRSRGRTKSLMLAVQFLLRAQKMPSMNATRRSHTAASALSSGLGVLNQGDECKTLTSCM